MEMKPIAIFKTSKKNPYEAARQGAADTSKEIGEIHFFPQQNFEQALEGLEGFSHVWLVYQFHHNTNWKPKVLPPRGSSQKIGVFATRSPYRPNPIGMSCVELVEIKGLVLKVRGFDLLDETPILDIKPYVSYADSFPIARMGWLENIESQKFGIEFSQGCQEQLQFLSQHGLSEIQNFILQQLSYEPLNSKKKRVQSLEDGTAVLAYRTWRIQFSIEGLKIQVLQVFSGYSNEDLENSSNPYQDKSLHLLFTTKFKSN